MVRAPFAHAEDPLAGGPSEAVWHERLGGPPAGKGPPFLPGPAPSPAVASTQIGRAAMVQQCGVGPSLTELYHFPRLPLPIFPPPQRLLHLMASTHPVVFM